MKKQKVIIFKSKREASKFVKNHICDENKFKRMGVMKRKFIIICKSCGWIHTVFEKSKANMGKRQHILMTSCQEKNISIKEK